MAEYNHVLLLIFSEGVIFILFLLGIWFYVFIDLKIKDYRLKFTIRRMKKVEKIVVAIVLIPITIVGIWFSHRSLEDYFRKDYLCKKGIVTYINSSKSLFNKDIVIDNTTYYIPISMIKNVEKGKKYKFIYTKRRYIILGIDEMKN